MNVSAAFSLSHLSRFPPNRIFPARLAVFPVFVTLTLFSLLKKHSVHTESGSMGAGKPKSSKQSTALRTSS